MQESNPSQETVTGELNVSSAEGLENASLAVKDVLSETLGRKFDSDEVALKSVKETFDYVGKAGKYAKAVQAVAKSRGVSEDEAVKIIMDSSQPEVIQPQQAPAVDTNKFVSREEFEEKTFYAENKDYTPFKEIISALRTQTGKPLSEVVELDSFKSVYTKSQAADEMERTKSVLTTNPRLGQATDKLSQAKDAISAGQSTVGGNLAADAVIEAFNL